MAITGSVDLGDGKLAITVDHDPRTTATDAPKGSLLINTATGKWYRKADDGSSTAVEVQSPAVITFNVDDFGAVGDSSTDDFAAIQDAINAANTAGGGIVLLSSKTYKCDTAPTWYSNIIFRGIGPSSVLKMDSSFGAGANFINPNSLTNITFENFRVDCNGWTGNFGGSVFYCTAIDGLNVEGISCINDGGSTLRFVADTCTFASIDRITFVGSSGSTGFILINCTDCNINRVSCNSFTNSGFSIDGCARIIADSINASNNATGIRINNSTNCIIRGITSGNSVGVSDAGTCTGTVYEIDSINDSQQDIQGIGSRYIDLDDPSRDLSQNIIIVPATRSANNNGDALVAGYAAAKILIPGGNSLSATNRAKVLLYPGTYAVDDGSLILDTEFVDLVGIGGPNGVIISSRWLQDHTACLGAIGAGPGYGWDDVAWSPSLDKYVAVASDGDVVNVSSDGISWRTFAVPTGGWTSVCWAAGLGLFVAVAGYGTNRVMTSNDGENWDIQTASDMVTSWTAVCWAEELTLLVAVGVSGTDQVMTSPDGINWTSHSASESNSWNSVVWSPELTLFVAVSSNGTNRVMTSPNGTDWTNRTAAEVNNWNSIAWSPTLGMFVVSCYNGDAAHTFMYSTNGTAWTVIPNFAGAAGGEISWSPELGIFIVPQYNGNIFYSDVTGLIWASNNVGSSATFHPSVWSPDLAQFIVMNTDSGGPHKVFTSSNGINWTEHDSRYTADPTTGAGRYVILGDAGGDWFIYRDSILVVDGSYNPVSGEAFPVGGTVALTDDEFYGIPSGKGLVHRGETSWSLVASGDWSDTSFVPTAGVAIRQTADDVRIQGITIKSILEAWASNLEALPTAPAAYFPDSDKPNTVMEDVILIGTCFLSGPQDGAWPMRTDPAGSTLNWSGKYRRIVGGDKCFCGNDVGGSVGLFEDCTFNYNPFEAVTISATIRRCTGNVSGSGFSASSPSTYGIFEDCVNNSFQSPGIYRRCRAISGTFDARLGNTLIDSCRSENASGYMAIDGGMMIINCDVAGYYYIGGDNCRIYNSVARGSNGTDSIAANNPYNCSINGCSLNKQISANLTNVIASPNNVVDVAIT